MDQTVAKIGYAYNDAGGDVLNQVKETYDGVGNLVGDAQSHGGAVTGASPTVGYAYDPTRASWRARPTPTAARLSTAIGQLGSISDSSGTLASYSYLGLNTPVSQIDGNGRDANDDAGQLRPHGGRST